MADPRQDTGQTLDALDLVRKAAEPYLASLSGRPVHDHATDALLDALDGPLPETGDGTVATVERLLDVGISAATHSAGPRFFHFVTGGSTPAALAADWTTSLLDQNAAAWVSSPLAARAETIALRWLRDLFGLPAEWEGVLTTSATDANFTALSAARHWWGEKHGVDVTADGLAGLPQMPVLSGGYVHASVRRALQMLGVGRDTIRMYARDGAGRVDLEALERGLIAAGGPAVISVSAGEVNAGDFDPIDALADLAGRYGAWLHVDGAFGLFAAVSPRTAHLLSGIERADSVISDGHKWLNVPYESGFAFVRERGRLDRTFGAAAGAAYLPGEDDPHANFAHLGPDASRRARSLPIWATLRAYGRDGYRAMVERHLDLAQHLAGLVGNAPDLELLAEPQLCVVCFRVRPPGVPEAELDALNTRVGDELLADGRVFAGTTVYDGKVALRPAIVNWSTGQGDIELLIDVIREATARLSS